MPVSSTTKSKGVKNKNPVTLKTVASRGKSTTAPPVKKAKPLCVLENAERIDVVEAERLITACQLDIAKAQRMLLAVQYAHQMKWYMLRQKYALPEEMTFNRETGMVTEKAKEKTSG